MNKLGIYGLAAVLIVSAGAAMAGDKRHGDRHEAQHGKHYRYHDNRRHYRSYEHYRNYRPGHYRGRHYGKHHYGKHHYGKHHYGRHHYRDYHYPSYFGAALLGSALSHNFYHTHQGATCYQDHSADNYRSADSGYSEISGCYRIERLPDGSERRVDVPLSECD